MPLETETLVDRVPLRAARQPARKRSWISWTALLQGSCLVFVEGTSFIISNLVLALGIPMLFLLLLSSWDLGPLFSLLGSLADHYLSAEPVARRLFVQDLRLCFAIMVGTVALVRLPGFLIRLHRSLSQGII